MFTGIIEDVGFIADIRKSGGKWEFCIKTYLSDQGIYEGDSIAVDGVCLTATRLERGTFYADASLETLNLTTLKNKKSGDPVNIERAMASDGRFGGHFVMGHVDGIGTIKNIKTAGDSIRIEIEIPQDLSRYIVKKGSITIDGISLTVNEQHDNMVVVNIIPFTSLKATIGKKRMYDKVNIETDIIGKYIERFMEKPDRKGISMGFLYEQGFIKGE